MSELSAQDPDFPLVEAIAQGEASALQELYARHGLHILRYLIGKLGEQLAAEEVLQDVMLAVWHKASGFRGDCQVRTWLFSIARNKAYNRLEKIIIRQNRERPKQDIFPDEQTNVESIVLEHEQRESVSRAIELLPEEQREALELATYFELKVDEIAKIQGVVAGTVKSRLYLARQALKRLLVKEGFDHA